MTTLREGLSLGARAFGARGERIAAEALTAAGYAVLAQKFVIPGGEIDIVAAKGDVVAFVEVKARPRAEAGLAAIGEGKRRRLARAAAAWLGKNPWAAEGYVLRGDAVIVDANLRPHHIEDAFGLEFEG